MTKAISKLHAVCPHCGETGHTLEHLRDGTNFGPWYCDGCGGAYGGVFRGADTELVKDAKGRRQIKVLTLLEHPAAGAPPLRFLVDGYRFVDDLCPDGEEDNKRFFYEEHSCPTNWIGDSRMIAWDGDHDPHGFLRYVRQIDTPELPDNCMEEDAALLALFPEMLSSEPIKQSKL